MIRKRVEKSETIINLDGPDGNANNLIGLAIRIMRDSRMTEEEIKPIVKEMTSSDYKNLVMTFDNYFKSSVILETTNEELLS
tara:strand:- start:274 stop:519 length:246 start_codon:yes stop_codon:yes gene_type:complete